VGSQYPSLWKCLLEGRNASYCRPIRPTGGHGNRSCDVWHAFENLDGEALDIRDQELWDAVKRQVPEWALFKRLSLTDEQKLAGEKAERQVEQEFESLGPAHDGA